MPLFRHIAACFLGVALLGCNGEGDGNLTTQPASTTDGECGDLGCNSGFRISLVAIGSLFDAGEYEVFFIVDEVPRDCAFRITFDDFECGGDPPCFLESTCNAEFNLVVQPHSIAFVVGPDPDLLDVRVQRDGTLIASEVLAPQYEVFAPNGPDCEPICMIAEAELPIP